MAEETKVETPPTPMLDEAKIREIVQQGTQAAIEAKETEQKTAQAEEARRATAAKQGEDPVRKVIMDAVGDDLRQANFRAAAAEDAAKFYLIHPDAREYAADVEKKFNELAGAGNAQDRESIWHYYRGLNFDKFHAQANQAALQKAEEAMVVGPGGTMTRVRQVSDPYAMSSDELAKALDGVAF